MKPGRFRVGVIGAGRVGPVLARSLQLAEHEIIGVTRSRLDYRNDKVQALLGVPSLEVEQVCKADLVLIAISDDQIQASVDQWADAGYFRPNQIVLHTSGAHGVSVLSGAQRAGALPIALHPAMTFSGWSLDLARLEGCPAAVTAPAVSLPIGTTLAYEMGMEPTVVAEGKRVLYHAGLAHGANHLVSLVVEAAEIIQSAGIENPQDYLRPLLLASLESALDQGVEGLTGPVRRGDTGTISAHLATFEEAGMSSTAKTYKELARLTAELSAKAGQLSETQAAQLEALLK